jgi:hypothetical protein
MNRYKEGSNLLYTQNQKEIAKAIKFYGLEKDHKGELSEVVVIYFTTSVHNMVLIRENNPINALFVLFALPIKDDELELHEHTTALLEACNITTDHYSREFEQLQSYTYQQQPHG